MPVRLGLITRPACLNAGSYGKLRAVVAHERTVVGEGSERNARGCLVPDDFQRVGHARLPLREGATAGACPAVCARGSSLTRNRAYSLAASAAHGPGDRRPHPLPSLSLEPFHPVFRGILEDRPSLERGRAASRGVVRVRSAQTKCEGVRCDQRSRFLDANVQLSTLRCVSRSYRLHFEVGLAAHELAELPASVIARIERRIALGHH